MFRKVLIANRGEIAMRVLRACRELNIRTVAVHSDVDALALHVRFADEAVCIGPAPAAKSYLNIPALIAAAEITGSDAIHPGYGFLAENATFAEVVAQCGLTFIGPRPEAMRTWGDKLRARETAVQFGLPLLPGSVALTSAEHAAAEATRIGFPVILKARGGGGGRGMRVVKRKEDIQRAYEAATAEAQSAFGNPEMYVERFIDSPRHVEFQVLADQHGGIWVLGERECSLQRRHQKLVEESPCVAINDEIRVRMIDVIRRAIAHTEYTSLGTLEFLMDERGELYFMEMNTRVQVEHPVTEMVTGVDLVVQQIRAAAGEHLDLASKDIWQPRGHAIECRIAAEDPDTFIPWPGTISEYHPPGGAGVRVDSGVYGGWKVPSAYDSLLAKVIVHAPNRQLALQRMRGALDEFIITGIRTNIPLHKFLLDSDEMRNGKMTTRTIERLVAERRSNRRHGLET
jgi:acetyl-CoA carboxylase, biotin carboxylase subunit